jgi:hypothetical protein
VTPATPHILTEQQAAAVRFLAERWAQEGGRHKAYGALAGGLLRDGLPEADVAAIAGALADLTGDEEAGKRLARVAETAATLKGGGPATGWPALAKLLGEGGQATVTRFRGLLGLAFTLEQLAEHKGLPAEFLRELGLRDLDEGGVGIDYRDAGGKVLATKRRTKLAAGDGSFWPRGKPLLAYGEDHLDAATAVGDLTVVEGESDCWALWHHGLPALGLPGAETVGKTLCLGHVAAVRRVYVHREPDASGGQFVENVRRRLAALGWGGDLRVVRLDGHKDPSDLHRADPEGFPAAWRKALRVAEPVAVEGPAPAAPADPPPPAGCPWPDALAEEAFHGLAGDLVRVLGPASEADPAALLVQALVAFGNQVGRTAHFVAEADKHFANEFANLVGKTSKGRKGTSWGRTQGVLCEADPEWAGHRVASGLASGEGLLWEVRDRVMKRERVKEGGEVRYEEVEADPGIPDKRLLLYEPEFAGVLRQIERQGNTLSAVLRMAWDSGNLRSLVKNSPVRATGAHVSLIGHVTAEELRRYLSTTETANGFGNRFLWVCVQRSKSLPEGGRVDEGALADLRRRFADALVFARGQGEMARDGEAREVWREVYDDLSEGRPGLAGALLARAEAHVMRLAMIYALLDHSPVIAVCHLLAGLAVWQYAEQSVYHVFGDSLGDPLADEVLRVLRGCPEGMSRTDLMHHFERHQKSDRIGRALALLAEHRLAYPQRRETGGRPEERWFARTAAARR